MSAPIKPVPDPQHQAFSLAMAKRLGVDPQQVTEHGFSFRIGDVEDVALVTWNGIAALPADEVVEMFNAAAAGA